MSFAFADAIFWVAVVCCAVAQWFILRGAIVASAGPAASARVPAARRTAEAVWAVIPAVGLAVVLGLTWRAMHPPSPRARELPAPRQAAAPAVPAAPRSPA